MRWGRKRRADGEDDTPTVEASNDPDVMLDDPIAESRRLAQLRMAAAHDLRVIAERIREARHA